MTPPLYFFFPNALISYLPNSLVNKFNLPRHPDRLAELQLGVCVIKTLDETNTNPYAVVGLSAIACV